MGRAGTGVIRVEVVTGAIGHRHLEAVDAGIGVDQIIDTIAGHVDRHRIGHGGEGDARLWRRPAGGTGLVAEGGRCQAITAGAFGHRDEAAAPGGGGTLPAERVAAQHRATVGAKVDALETFGFLPGVPDRVAVQYVGPGARSVNELHLVVRTTAARGVGIIDAGDAVGAMGGVFLVHELHGVAGRSATRAVADGIQGPGCHRGGHPAATGLDA